MDGSTSVFMYEESFRTPLLIYFPGGKHGVINEMVQNIDYAPTFLDVAGAKIPSDIQGRSFLPLLEGKKPSDWRKSLYYHYYEYPCRALCLSPLWYPYEAILAHSLLQ